MRARSPMAVLGSMWLIAACGAGAGGEPSSVDAAGAGPAVDARTRDAEAEGRPDAGPALRPDAVARPECACEPDETCAGCIAHISECCYGDREAFGQVSAIAATCEANGACRVCCRECEATPCEVLEAGGSCPFSKRATP